MTSSDKASIGRLTSSLHQKAHMFIGARQRACSTMAITWSHGSGGRVNPYPRIDARSWCKPGGRHSSGRGATLARLIGLYTINWVTTCSLIYNKDLTYGECIRLDCCDVIAVTEDHGMTIITLGRFYFTLSHQLTLTDALHQETCMRRSYGHLGRVTPFIRSELGSHLG
jgi:hypothetical protein